DHLARDHADLASPQLFRLVLTQQRHDVLEQDDVGTELAEQQCLMHRAGTGGKHTDGLVADLPAVAVRAVQDVPPPSGPETGQIREFVHQPTGYEHPTSTEAAPVR